MTLGAQPIGGGRQRKIASLLGPNVEIVIVVVKIFYAAEQTLAPGRLSCLELVTDPAIILIRKSLRGHSTRLGRRSAVTHEADRMALLSFEFDRPHLNRLNYCRARVVLAASRSRLLGLRVAISAARACSRTELRAVRWIAYRRDAKVRRQRLAMCLVREGILKVADLRSWEDPWPQRFVGPRDSSRLVTDATEPAGLAECRLEELRREVVTADASAVREILCHRLIGVPRFLFCGEMAISALNLYVFLLIVRETSTPGSVFRLSE